MSRSIISKVLILLALSLPSASWGAVAADAFSNTKCGSSCPTVTLAHTNTATVSNMVVAAFNACRSGQTAPTVTGMTYAGTSLTLIKSVNPDASRWGYLYGWPAGSAPTTGTNNIVVTYSASIGTACDVDARVSVIGFSVTGSDTTSQYVDSQTNSGTGTTASLTVSSNPTGALGFSAGCSGDGVSSSTEGTIDVIDPNTTNSCGTSFAMDVAPTDASWSFAIPSDSWITAGLVFNVSGGGGGGGSTPASRLPILGVGP